MARASQIIFRIFYSTSFTAVFLILIVVICVTPADALYESYKRSRLIDIFLLVGAYVVTALFAVLIFASRLYTNRSILKDIPKTFIPIDEEDLPGRRVHKLIQECLERSAVIAYQARPRSQRIEHDTINAGLRMLSLTKSRTCTDQTLEPPWGKIAHPGWSSPASKNLPNLEYATVVDELVDLVEAKAVSLVPIDPVAAPAPDGSPMPDPRVIDQISRNSTMGMRQYLKHLIDMGVVPETSLSVAFLVAYERARFSSEPLTDDDFQALMRMFAELLRSMTPVDVELLDLDDASFGSDTETSSLADRNHHIEPLLSQRHLDADTLSAASTFSESGSVRRHRPPPRRVSDDSVPSLSSIEKAAPSETGSTLDTEAYTDALSLQTAPTTAPHSRSRPSNSRMVSAVSRQSLHSAASNESLTRRSRHSSRSGRSNAGITIRLTREGEDRETDLPYRIEMPSTGEEEDTA